MKDKGIEERLQRIEDTLEDLSERVMETADLVQGHFEGLADTIREAEETIRRATEEAVEQLTEEPAYPPSMRSAIERIEDALENLGCDLSETPAEGIDSDDEEAFYEKVREVVEKEQRASTSLLQRRLKIGYGRAARYMDMLEERGVIEGSDGMNRPRRVVADDTQ